MLHGIRHNNVTYENIIHAGANRIIYFYDYRQNIFDLFDMPVFTKTSGIKTYHVFINLSHIEAFRETKILCIYMRSNELIVVALN